MSVITSRTDSLTSYKQGSISELISIFLPLLFSVCSGSLMSFCDRVFISHYSLISLESVTTANYYCMIFQLAFICITATSQVSIANSLGERDLKAIGPHCWQMIWFSLFSMLLTFPLGLGLSHSLFYDTEIGTQGHLYFKVLMYGNFLFPLAAGISAYFIGLGCSRPISVSCIIAQAFNLVLDYVFIFGIEGVIPAMGVMGAALATVLSQAIFCILLFALFIKDQHAKEYCNRQWRFNFLFLKKSLRLGIPKSLSKISVLIAWAAAVRLVSKVGGDYLIVLSVGSSIWLLLNPLNIAIEHVLTSQVSFYRGCEKYHFIWKSVSSAILLVFIIFLILGILFVLFLNSLLDFFIQETLLPHSLQFIKQACLWVWILFLLEGLSCTSLGLITGLGKTFFTLKMNLVINWPTIFLPYYLAFHYWSLTPDTVWMLPWICMIFASVICFIKGGMSCRKISQECLGQKLHNFTSHTAKKNAS